jgi:hypothetical protein
MATSDVKIYKVWKWDKFFELGKLFVKSAPIQKTGTGLRTCTFS